MFPPVHLKGEPKFLKELDRPFSQQIAAMVAPRCTKKPFLLLSCGSRPECFCSFSDGRTCELSGRHLRVTSLRGETEYISLDDADSNLGGSEEEASGCAYISCASHDKRKLVALGGAGIKANIKVIQLSCTPPRCAWRHTLNIASPMEILSLEFSPCGRRLFCLSSWLQPAKEQHPQYSPRVYHVTILKAFDGEMQACHLLQWDDSASFPTRLLAGNSCALAVVAETNLMVLQVLRSNEDKVVTSGLLLPVTRGPTIGSAGDVRITGACWIAATATGKKNGSNHNLLFLALSNKLLLALGIGCLGTDEPFLAWATTSEDKYISLAAEDGTGILLGLTESSVLHTYKLNEGAAERVFQETQVSGLH